MCLTINVKRNRSISFVPNREGPRQVGLKEDEYPSRANQDLCRSRERKEEQQQQVVGTGDCF